MTGDIAAGISALSGIRSIAEGLIAMRDNSKVLETKLALMTQVFDIRQALDALQDEVSTLKQANRELELKNQQLQQHIAQADQSELFEVTQGVYVLAAKPTGGEAHRPPYFCQACQSNGKQTVLAFAPPVFDFDPGALNCPANPNHNIPLANRVTAQSLGFRS